MAKQIISYDPQVLDLTLYAGDGAGFRLVVTDSDDVAIDLTGEIIAQIRKERHTSDPSETSFTVDLSDAVDGIAVLTLSGEDTHSLIIDGAKYSGVWDAQWTPTGSEPVTLCQGSVECLPDVSH